MMGLRGDGRLKGGQSRYAHGARERELEKVLDVLSSGHMSVQKRDVRWISGQRFGRKLCLQCLTDAVRITNMKANSHTFIMAHILYKK